LWGGGHCWEIKTWPAKTAVLLRSMPQVALRKKRQTESLNWDENIWDENMWSLLRGGR